MKILAIYNSFSNLYNESEMQLQGYIDGLSSILMQRGVDQDVVWSSCLNTTACRNYVMDCFGDSVFYSFIDELQPLPVTVNLTAQAMTTLRGRGGYDAYLYVDSGIRLNEDFQIAQLVHTHKDNNAGMTSGLTDTDTGLFEACGWGEYIDDHRDIDKFFKHGIYQFKIGEACSLHFQLFDRSIYEFFGERIYTDIWASHCSESCFSHICASINKPYIITNEVKVQHLIGMDGASGGFSPAEWVRKGNNRLDHAYKTRSIFEIFREGQPLGLGFQEFGGGVIAPKDQFSPEGFALNDALKYYIRDHLFLNKNQLDYGSINRQLIAL